MASASSRTLKVPRRIASTSLALLLLSNAFAQSPAQETSPFQQRLERAAALTSLDAPGTRPWHLRLSLTTTEGKLPPVEEAVEEWWAAPERWRVDYTNAAGVVTSERHTAEGLFRTKDAARISSRDRVLLRQVVHPLPPKLDPEKFHLEALSVTLNNRSFDCIAVAPLGLPGKQVRSAAETRYCFEPGSDLLRLTYPTPHRIIARVTLGKFQEQDVPMGLQDRSATDRLTIARLVELKSEPADPAKFDTQAGLEKVPERVIAMGGVMAGHKLSGHPPNYPLAAKRDHLSGQVILNAIVGTDGHIKDLEAESSPSAALTQASMEAVRDWTYEPFLLGSSPVEVETSITVNFYISP